MDKEKLLAPRATTASGMPEDDVEIPGLGTVRVRALNRAEAILVQKIKDIETRERKILHLALIDPAGMTEHECGDWMRIGLGGEFDPVSNRIAELSGLAVEAPKAVYREFEENPDAEFRALPSTEAVDDGGRPAGADE